jgi:hypothetical protein
MMMVENKYDFGDVVYLVTDSDQEKRIVTAIKIYPSGGILYQLSCGTENSDHYEFEISKEEDTVLKTK